MKRLTLAAALMLGTTLAAHATMETKIINGCVVIRTNAGNTWQRLDPNCAGLAAHAGNGSRPVPVDVPDDEDPEEPDDDEPPKDDEPCDEEPNGKT